MYTKTEVDRRGVESVRKGVRRGERRRDKERGQERKVKES
jgi:hypothetical protein